MKIEPMHGLVGDHSRWPPNLKPEDFPRGRMTDWLGPAQLARTGMMAVVSGVFGAYADQRSSMAALDSAPRIYDYSGEEELWIDYVADLGDGFDATYTVARLLAEPALAVAGCAAELPRGRILVMGGDEGYPTAGFAAYKNRTVLPYRAALSAVAPAETVPDLFAIPGNHDWYDGLTSFRRVFCDQRWFGAWKTHQRRSYFALKLPHGWWLWGIDTQLGENIDQPQLAYFGQVAAQMKEGDRVVLCSPQPGWVEGPAAFRPLAFLEGDVIAGAAKAKLRLALSGDLHHYCRYEAAGEGIHRITAGGGGAYLFATHEMPDSLDVLSDGEAPPVHYRQKSCFPDRDTSRRLVWGCLRLPFRSRRFTTFLAAIYALFCWFLQTASRATFVPDLTNPTAQPSSIMEKMKDWGLSWCSAGKVVTEFFRVLAHSPSSTMFSLVIVAGLVAFCAAPGWRKGLYGGLHGLAHLSIAVLALWGASVLNLRTFGMDVDSIRQVLLFCLEIAAFGSLAGGLVMALYLLASSVLGGFHTNEAFSCQHIADYKNFLRLHLDREGKLTVYPIGIEKATTDWKYAPAPTPGSPWYEGTPPKAALLEEPIPIV